ncbi:MAG: 4Fe-4S binding protein [Candidatus Cloacimonetes bacterium]|nr:4Fe-4S binding protein [Candidatus Cloacimonadota bacterium]
MKNKYILLLIIVFTAISILAVTMSAIYVESNSCVGCGDCEQVCPVDAIQIIDGKAVIDAEKCIQCEICIKSCTYNAIRKSK